MAADTKGDHEPPAMPRLVWDRPPAPDSTPGDVVVRLVDELVEARAAVARAEQAKDASGWAKYDGAAPGAEIPPGELRDCLEARERLQAAETALTAAGLRVIDDADEQVVAEITAAARALDGAS